MPNVRLTWTNNSSGHDGQRVRMDEPNSAGPDTVIADLDPAVEEYIVLDATEPEACFTIAAYEGAAEEESGEACVETVGVTDWDSVSIGDEVEGGIYAGIITYADAREFRLIVATASGEAASLAWNTSTYTTGITDADDGFQNTIDAAAEGGTYPAFDHCSGYASGGYDDWYLPSENELDLIYTNLSGHAEFSDNVSSGSFTWSSTERSSAWAYYRRFSDGASGNLAKTNTTTRVRPIRRVPV